MTLELVVNKQEILDCVGANYTSLLPVIKDRHYEADFTGRYGLYEITIVSVANSPTDEPVPSSDEVSEERV
jgi:hypothetical protein